MARGLAASRVTVVSGLARGVDAVAHRAAIDAGGRTIAVLACGLDIVYPPEHKLPAEQIMEQGALISDYPPGTQPRSEFFPRRNRILSGISLGVLIVEGDVKSGAMITARQALEQNREVFAVPRGIHPSDHPATRRTARPPNRGQGCMLCRMAVRQLSSADIPTLRALRLQALADAPDSFGSTYEREERRSLVDWQRWFRGGSVFVYEQPVGSPVGMVAAVRDTDDPAGQAYLTAMWVHPGSRGTGAANALVQSVIDWAAAEKITLVRLHVLDRNEPARRVYARHGFHPTGVQLTRERDGAVELEMQLDWGFAASH